MKIFVLLIIIIVLSSCSGPIKYDLKVVLYFYMKSVQWLLGRRKLTVSVNYANMPLEYLYLSQYHGFPNPVAGTPLGAKFGLTTKPNKYNDPAKPGAYSKPPQVYLC